jgi:hypothetical protein
MGHLDLGKTGMLDINLPISLSDAPPYARLGDWILLVLAIFIGIYVTRYKSSRG